MAEQTFREWAQRWLKEGRWPGPHCSDIDARIERILKLWDEEIPEVHAPGVPDSWRRPVDADLTGAVRDRRKKLKGDAAKEEHELEIQVLGAAGTPLEAANCLGGALLDGFNAVKLVWAPHGGPAQRVEADILLLTKTPTEYRQLLLEVKTKANQPFYALVENLRQLRLFQASKNANTIFSKRNKHLGLPTTISVTAAVLAPMTYYTAKGQKGNALVHCHTLIEQITPHLPSGTAIDLTTWDPAKRVFRSLTPGLTD